MIPYKVVVQNKEIKKIVYGADSLDDSQLASIKSKIHAVWNNCFINRRGETLDLLEIILDVSDKDKITVLSYDNDENSILETMPDGMNSNLSTNRADREFHNDTQTIEIEYSTTSVPFTMPSDVSLRRQTHNFNSDYTDKGTYNVYVIGTVANVDALVKSENSSLSATIPSGYTLSATDSFKLLYNSSDELQSCTLSPQDSFPYTDQNLPTSIYHNLLLDKSNIYWTFDLTNTVKTVEIPYNIGSAYPVEPLGKNLTLLMISEEYDSSFNNTNVQHVYVQGRLNDVYTWAKSLKSDIELPIPDDLIQPDKILFEDDEVLSVQESEFVANDDMDWIMSEDGLTMMIKEHELINSDKDYFKFTFDSDDNLTSVQLFGNLDVHQVRSRKARRQFNIEHSLRYSDGITNLSVTETLMPDSACRIVTPKYDTDGYRYADD